MDLVEYQSLIRRLLILEIVLFLIGETIVTNMHPLWMQQTVVLLFWSIIITALVYYFGVMRVRY